MTYDSVEKALLAANEFIWAVREMRVDDHANGGLRLNNTPYARSKYTDALKRKSMELTRALDEMRRHRHG